jgi:hypothetical protein
MRARTLQGAAEGRYPVDGEPTVDGGRCGFRLTRLPIGVKVARRVAHTSSLPGRQPALGLCLEAPGSGELGVVEGANG